LTTEVEAYRKYSHMLLTHMHNFIVRQTYLDVLQYRYGHTLGSFFFQTPAAFPDVLPPGKLACLPEFRSLEMSLSHPLDPAYHEYLRGLSFWQTFVWTVLDNVPRLQ
jgi:hypothetical protein